MPGNRNPNDFCFTIHVHENLDVMVNTDGEMLFKDPVTGATFMESDVEEMREIIKWIDGVPKHFEKSNAHG